jgi:hypothetical protein
VFSMTIQRGGKITKSATAVPSSSEGQVNTVYMLGSVVVFQKRIRVRMSTTTSSTWCSLCLAGRQFLIVVSRL